MKAKILPPREKILRFGAKQLTNNDLLALIFVSGTRKESVYKISERIINDYGIEGVSSLTDLKTLSDNYALTQVKSMQFLAALELGRRIFSKSEVDFQVNCAQKVFDRFKFMQNSETEELRVIFLNQQNFFLGSSLIAKGVGNMVSIRGRDIFRQAMKLNAHGVILIHNHPSGNSTPSNDDIETTKRIQAAAQLIEINLLDHIIIGRSYFSFRKEGLMSDQLVG